MAKDQVMVGEERIFQRLERMETKIDDGFAAMYKDNREYADKRMAEAERVSNAAIAVAERVALTAAETAETVALTAAAERCAVCPTAEVVKKFKWATNALWSAITVAAGALVYILDHVWK